MKESKNLVIKLRDEISEKEDSISNLNNLIEKLNLSKEQNSFKLKQKYNITTDKQNEQIRLMQQVIDEYD